MNDKEKIKEAYTYMETNYVGKKLTINDAFLDLSQNNFSGILSDYQIRNKLREIGSHIQGPRGKGIHKGYKFSASSAGGTPEKIGKGSTGRDNYGLSGIL